MGKNWLYGTRNWIFRRYLHPSGSILRGKSASCGWEFPHNENGICLNRIVLSYHYYSTRATRLHVVNCDDVENSSFWSRVLTCLRVVGPSLRHVTRFVLHPRVRVHTPLMRNARRDDQAFARSE